MKAGTLKRIGLLKGMAVESTVRLPHVSWMSVHERDLARVARYEKECMIRKTYADPDGIKARINGMTVHLEAHNLTNGLVTATIHDPDGGLIYDAHEYSGIVPRLVDGARVIYNPVTRMAKITQNAILGNGFMLKHLDADTGRLSVYNRIRKEYATESGREMTFEYSIVHYGTGDVVLLEMQCVVAGAGRTEWLVIDADGQARINQVLINGKVNGKSMAAPRFESIAEKMVAKIISAVARGEDFTPWDLSYRASAFD